MQRRNHRDTVFISYSHQDIEWLELLRRHFKPLERDFKIKFWDDRNIKPGTKWQDEIKYALKTAKIAICLVSADFIGSEFITNNELPPLFEAAQKEGTIIIPLIISPCMFEESKLSQFQSVNNPDTEALTALSKHRQEQLFLKLSRTIEKEFHKANSEPEIFTKTPALTTKRITNKKKEAPKSAEEAEIFAEFQKEFKEANRRSFTFLLVGRTGVGKSSTINSLLGKRICKVGRYVKTTNEVKPHRSKIEGIRFSVVDTPGLGDHDDGDGSGEKKDRLYLRKVKSKIRRVDSMMFVTRLDEARVRSDEIRTVRLISELFGIEIWDRTVIVFTCADKVSPQNFIRDLNERTRLIRKEIAKHTKWTKARSIPAVAVANDEGTHKPLRTPDGNLWLGELFTQIFLRVSNEGAIPFYLATRRRIKIKKKPTTKTSKSTSTRSGFGHSSILNTSKSQILVPSNSSSQQRPTIVPPLNKPTKAVIDSDTFIARTNAKINTIVAQYTKINSDSTGASNSANNTEKRSIPLTQVQSKQVQEILESSNSSNQQQSTTASPLDKSAVVGTASNTFEDRINAIFAQSSKKSSDTIDNSTTTNKTSKSNIPLTQVQSKQVHEVLEKTKNEPKPRHIPNNQTDVSQIKKGVPLPSKLLPMPSLDLQNAVEEEVENEDIFIDEDNEEEIEEYELIDDTDEMEDELNDDVIVLTEKQAELVQKEVIDKNPILSAFEKFGTWAKDKLKSWWKKITGK